MKPMIDSTRFGSITIDGKIYDHDVVIRPNGHVEKRKKKLSKEVFGTSHLLSQAEAEHIFEEGVNRLIIGSGQTGLVRLSDEASVFFQEHHCEVELLTTPQAIRAWNLASGEVVGLFHVTC